ncbi:hypothetical protein BSG18_49890 [Pseudomonas ogarae]|nr:hypothetical protein BSG18_49890 [Pseudomonas ogarae]
MRVAEEHRNQRIGRLAPDELAIIETQRQRFLEADFTVMSLAHRLDERFAKPLDQSLQHIGQQYRAPFDQRPALLELDGRVPEQLHHITAVTGAVQPLTPTRLLVADPFLVIGFIFFPGVILLLFGGTIHRPVGRNGRLFAQGLGHGGAQVRFRIVGHTIAHGAGPRQVDGALAVEPNAIAEVGRDGRDQRYRARHVCHRQSGQRSIGFFEHLLHQPQHASNITQWDIALSGQLGRGIDQRVVGAQTLDHTVEDRRTRMGHQKRIG